jgi:hypothetical protein
VEACLPAADKVGREPAATAAPKLSKNQRKKQQKYSLVRIALRFCTRLALSPHRKILTQW